MRQLRHVFELVTDHSRIVLALLLVATLAVGSGVTQLETGTELQQFRGDSPEPRALDYVERNFSTARENVTVARVVVRDENAIDRETLLATLELQREFRQNHTVNRTLAADRPTVGLANVLARAVIHHRDPNATDPTLEEQIAVLESMSDAEVERAVTLLLSEDRPGPTAEAFLFVPNGYEPGTASANATMLLVVQSRAGPAVSGQASDRIVAAQSAMGALAADGGVGREAFVVGNGVVTAEQTRARQDSMRLVGPLALLFVLLTLAVAYRDALDVLLGLLGVGLVLGWTFGTLGWLGIPFSSVFVAVPVLLVGLSVDFAIHVFMRYREERASGSENARTPRHAMRVALPSVGTALVLVTLTTAIGFLSNLVSPVGPLRDIGVISAIGIASALVVFGAFVPALKVELDSLLERLGVDRSARPIGTGERRLTSVLSVGVRAATRSPVAVLFAVLLVSAGATYGATHVSTSFEPQDFYPGDTPEWMGHLPAGLQPHDYTVKRHARYANAQFVDRQSRAEILVEGNVTAPGTLARLDRARDRAGRKETVHRLSTGEPRTSSPLSVIERVAARNSSFAATVDAADTDDDGVPDRNLERVYDALFATAPQAAGRVIHRECESAADRESAGSSTPPADCEYRAVRLTVAVDGGASSQRIRAQLRTVAAVVEGPGTTAIATGDPIVRSVIQDELLGTLLESLLVTLVAVLLLLMLVYRVAYGSAMLGALTVVPVALTVSWIVASMALLGIPLSVLTALVASLTIGIGIDYCIHLTERYVQEVQAGKPPVAALQDTVDGTGAALLGSAVTTTSGFGVLALAVLPMLRQFGIVTALTIVYAFVAGVVVLPSLLVLWSRFVDGEASERGSSAVGRPVPTGEDD